MRTPWTLKHVRPVMHASSNQEQVLLCCGRAPQLTEERRGKERERKRRLKTQTKVGMSSGKRQDWHVTRLGNGVASDWLVAAWQVPRINGCRPDGYFLPMILLGTSSEHSTRRRHPPKHAPTRPPFDAGRPLTIAHSRSRRAINPPPTVDIHTHTSSHDYLKGRPDGRSPG